VTITNRQKSLKTQSDNTVSYTATKTSCTDAYKQSCCSNLFNVCV